MVATAVVGLVLLGVDFDESDFSAKRPYFSTLKTSALKLWRTRTTSEFFASLDTMRDNVVANTQDTQLPHGPAADPDGGPINALLEALLDAPQ